MHSKGLRVPSTWVYFWSLSDKKSFTGRFSLFMSVTGRVAPPAKKTLCGCFYFIFSDAEIMRLLYSYKFKCVRLQCLYELWVDLSQAGIREWGTRHILFLRPDTLRVAVVASRLIQSVTVLQQHAAPSLQSRSLPTLHLAISAERR